LLLEAAAPTLLAGGDQPSIPALLFPFLDKWLATTPRVRENLRKADPSTGTIDQRVRFVGLPIRASSNFVDAIVILLDLAIRSGFYAAI
jgi:hypothetical protein